MKKHSYEEYISIVKNILEDKEFLKLKKCNHHGTTRYKHSLNVSYNSYKLAKRFNLSYIEVARAALLHDFFNNEHATWKDRVKATFTHPLKAENNARDKFNITEKEAKIIRSHMFPINLTLPRDKESWIVTICDKFAYFNEYFSKILYKFSFSVSIFLIIFLNFIK